MRFTHGSGPVTQEPPEFLRVKATVLQDAVKKPDSKRFTGVYGNDGRAAVRVSDEMVAPLRAYDLEACPLQRSECLFTRWSRKPSHATVTR